MRKRLVRSCAISFLLKGLEGIRVDGLPSDDAKLEILHPFAKGNEVINMRPDQQRFQILRRRIGSFEISVRYGRLDICEAAQRPVDAQRAA